MTIFALETENTITAYDAHEEDRLARAENLEGTFSSEKEFIKLSKDWPLSRFAEVWNAFAGAPPFGDLKPVRKFTDRKSAVVRIWKAIQALAPAPAPQAAPAAAKKPKSAKGQPQKYSRTADRSARWQQESQSARTPPPGRWRHARRHHGCHRLAGSQRPGLHQRQPGQEDGTQGRIRQARRRRARLPHRPIATP